MHDSYIYIIETSGERSHFGIGLYDFRLFLGL
jgi:hypothetical protein